MISAKIKGLQMTRRTGKLNTQRNTVLQQTPEHAQRLSVCVRERGDRDMLKDRETS